MPVKPTIYEVARRAGVSTATVSRVVHGGTGYSERTAKLVRSAVEELGWVPDGSARGLARRRAGIVGVLFADLGKSAERESESLLFVDQVVRGAERAATIAGEALLIASTQGRAGRELAQRISARVDGLVVMAGSLPARDLSALAQVVPTVLIAGDSAARGCDVVAADNRGGTFEMTAHLVRDHGYRDLSFVSGPWRSPDSRQRFLGYCEALAAAGIRAPDGPDMRADFTEDGGARVMAELLADGGRPGRAMVFANDEMALGAMPVLRAAGARLPHEVAVTGFDDIGSARHVHPSLSTVRQPMRELGEAAVRVLLDRISEPDSPRRTLLLPTALRLRHSCGCPTRSVAGGHDVTSRSARATPT